MPSGIVSTAWPSVRDTCSGIGIVFDEWQASLDRAILGKNDLGLYAADTVVMSICRQAGKTFNVGGLVFADSIITPGTTTVWTAHRFAVSRESFNEMRRWARRPELAAHIDYDDITTATGNECIPFRNGSRILFKARERGAIRGFSKVRRLILDEAQILTEAAMSDLAPTTNQAWNPQIILMGTPPKPSDPGEVFTSLRASALAGQIDGVLYVEYSADENCGIDDWDAVAEANPSYPERTDQRAVLRLRKLLTNDEDYRREGLGIWPAEAGVIRWALVAQLKWSAIEDIHHRPTGPLRYAIDVDTNSKGEEWCSVGCSDGIHLEDITPPDAGPGTEWAVPTLEPMRDTIGELLIDPYGPARKLIAPLEQAGITLKKLTANEVSSSAMHFVDTVQHGQARHNGQPKLTRAVAGVARRDVGDGAFKFSRTNSADDISPLNAVAFACWASQIDGGPSVYEDRALTTL